MDGLYTTIGVIAAPYIVHKVQSIFKVEMITRFYIICGLYFFILYIQGNISLNVAEKRRNNKDRVSIAKNMGYSVPYALLTLAIFAYLSIFAEVAGLRGGIWRIVDRETISYREFLTTGGILYLSTVISFYILRLYI